MSTLFLTSADTKYEIFVPLYIFFALTHNEDALVEIFLCDVDAFKKKNLESLRVLNDLFPNKFLFTEVNFLNYSPNVVRFIHEPDLKDECDYVYIGDIDILIMDSDIEKQHKKNMLEHKIPFSNIIRPPEVTERDKFRLSGLHFAPMSSQYPLPDISDLDLSSENTTRGSDENILYEIMKRKKYEIPSEISFRPEHGFHISLNRHPTGSFSNGSKKGVLVAKKKVIYEWSGVHDRLFKEKFLVLISKDEYQKLFFTLDIRAQNILFILNNICLDRFDEYKNEMKKYVVGESILAPKIRYLLSLTGLSRFISF